MTSSRATGRSRPPPVRRWASLLQLARSDRFRTVNIVRRRAQVPDIKALGGEVGITSEDNEWGTQLATASEGKALSRAIDCVAGRTGETPSRLRMASRSRISASRIVRSLAVTSLPSDIRIMPPPGCKRANGTRSLFSSSSMVPMDGLLIYRTGRIWPVAVVESGVRGSTVQRIETDQDNAPRTADV